MKSIFFKRIEEALHENEQLTQSILDGAFDAIISMDIKGEIINWNKRAEVIFGWPADQVLGKPLSDIIIPFRFRESHKSGLKRFITEGKGNILNQQIEISALHSKGFTFPVEISISATRWMDSFIFTGIIRDISERKKAEEKTRKKSEEYEVMHKIAKKLHNCDSMECMLEEAMQVITNSKAFDFENFSSIYLLDEENNIFFLTATTGIYPDTCSEIDIRSLLNNVIVKKEIDYGEGSVNNFCLLDTSQNSAFKGLEDKGVYIVPLKWQGKIIGLLTLFASEATPTFEHNREILDSIGGLIGDAIQHYRCQNRIKEQNEKLAATNQSLQELNLVKNKFLGIASHDLRNPLYLIGSYSEALKEQLEGNGWEIQRSFAEKIFTSSEFMKSLLDNLLDISKIESGKYTLCLEKEDMNSLVENIAEIHQIIANKKSIKIKVNLAEIPLVLCDKNAVIQIMDNFIGNAIKFSPVNTKITVSTTKEGDEVRFSVKDEGPGICREEQELLFGDFQTLSSKPTGGEKSTGLGLAITKKLVDLHGGKIGVSCEPGRGSTFYFILPLNGKIPTLDNPLQHQGSTCEESSGG